MRKIALAASLAICGMLLCQPVAQAQGYAPWPPPPGMTAGEYVARYGPYIHQPGWGGPRHYPRRWQHRDPYATGSVGGRPRGYGYGPPYGRAYGHYRHHPGW
jgi:hypothetical protein